MQTLVHNIIQLAICLDQLLRVLLALVTWRRGWCDETLSAYTWRLYRDGKVAGKLLRPVIDWMFAWQASDPAYPGMGHCQRAYMRESDKQYLPPEYRK